MLTLRREPVVRIIISLLAFLILAVAAVGGVDAWLERRKDAMEQRYHNEQAQGALGKALYRKLLSCQLAAERLANAADGRDMPPLRKALDQDLAAAVDILRVLRSGGTYIDTFPANFDAVDAVSEPLRYESDMEPLPEAANLTILLADARRLAERLASPDGLAAKQLASVMARLMETVGRTLYDAQARMAVIVRDKAETRGWAHRVSLWVGVAAVAGSAALTLLALRRIREVLAQQAEDRRQLAETREGLAQLIEQMPVGLALVGPDKRIRHLNAQAVSMLGDVVGQPCRPCFQVDNEQCCPLDGGLLVHESECTLRGAGPENLTVVKRAVPIVLDGERLVLEAFVDVSQLKRSQERVREQQALIQVILDSVPAGIMVIDPDTHAIQDMNASALRMIGAGSVDEVRGRECHQFVCKAQKGHCPVTDRGQTVDNAQRELLGLSGTPLDILKSVVRADIGGKSMLIESFVDISALKRTQRELEAARLAADEASAAKGRFLANMSHEIRTPMNSILGLAQLLESDPDTPDRAAHLRVIAMSARNLLGLIDDLLDFSRIEAGKLELHPEPADVARLAQDARSTLLPIAQGKGIRLECDLENVPAASTVDPVRLRQVLINLLGNAVKFTQQGRVSLRVSLLGRHNGLDVLHFVVADTGIGIPPDKQEAIFEAFQQADGGITRRFGGSGLGLAISNRLARAMGADAIHLESEPGRGSTFSFSLALAPAAAPAQAAAEDVPAETARLSGLRVLVAEDNTFNQHLMRSLLAKAGIADVAFAGDGRQAVVEALRRPEGFDVIFMDMQMPEMDGLQASAALRAEGFTRPIVALTANAYDEDRQRCLQAGMSAFLSKPVSYQELLRTLHDCLEASIAA